jgi:hypothetical protein
LFFEVTVAAMVGRQARWLAVLLAASLLLAAVPGPRLVKAEADDGTVEGEGTAIEDDADVEFDDENEPMPLVFEEDKPENQYDDKDVLYLGDKDFEDYVNETTKYALVRLGV